MCLPPFLPPLSFPRIIHASLAFTGKVLRKVLALEREAENGRRELAACLEEADASKRRSLEAAKTARNLDSLRRERSALEVGSVGGGGVPVFSRGNVVTCLEKKRKKSPGNEQSRRCCL